MGSYNFGFEGMNVVDPQGRTGALALLWREVDQARLFSFSQNHIDVETNISDIGPW